MASKIITPDAQGLRQAAAQLQSGGVVAFPTETVYGLGADATNSESVAKIFAMKQRPHFNPLIIHTANKEAAVKLGSFNEAAHKLADTFWQPEVGGLTLVLPTSNSAPTVSALALAGGATIALRVPAHPIARRLLEESGLILAAPSANPSGRLSPTRASHVAQSFAGEELLILDGGATSLGLESTIVACFSGGVFLLRAGSVPRESVEDLLGLRLQEIKDEDEGAGADARVDARADAPRLSAGRLARHYAPRATLRLNARAPESGEGFLGFGEVSHGHFNLSERGDLSEAAQNFFSLLHEMDSLYTRIGVAPIPEEGLGIAINDRLHRASATQD